MQNLFKSLLFFLFFTPALCQADQLLNFRYDYNLGMGVEYGFGNFSLSAYYTSYILDNNTISLTTAKTTSSTMTSGKLTWYFSGAGKHSGYLGLIGGSAVMTLNETIASTLYTGSGTESLYGINLGYIWHWGHFNLNVGGILMSGIQTTITTRSAAGAVGSTKNDNVFVVPFDFGIGFGF